MNTSSGRENRESCSLADQHCVPCRGGIPPLDEKEVDALRTQIDRQWEVIDNHHIERVFSFPDFRSALQFTVEAGEIAEKEDHHPEITLTWGKVTVRIWSHKIGGLSENDFILAGKIDRIPRQRSRN